MMEIPGDVLESMVQQTVKVGDVFFLEMDANDGVTPKPGDSTRFKFFVVLGFDGEGNVYGGVIINSRINQSMDQTVKDYHMPIKCGKYPFLRYDSFVDCLWLKTAPLEKFTKGKYVGKMASDDLELIIGTLKDSPREKKIKLLKFGIL
mgnify:CR=1 FL=1